MKTFSKFVLIYVFVISCLNGFSQVAINNDGSNPDQSAQLDVVSKTKGFLPPRMTATERSAISNPAAGLLVYDITALQHYYYNGTLWKKVSEQDGTWEKNLNNLYSTVSGNVGIGTSNPSSKLHVISSETATGWKPMSLFKNYAMAPSNTNSNYFSLDAEIYLRGHYNYTSNDQGSAAAFFSAYHDGTGTVTKLSGIESRAYNLNVGTVTNLNAVSSYIESQLEGGTITNAVNFRAKTPYRFQGVINNTYGIFIEPQKLETNTGWGVYVEGSSDYNYFAGKVGIGISTPAYHLDIEGDINLSTTNNLIRIGGIQFLSSKGTGNTLLGYSAGNVTTGIYNTFVGNESAISNTNGNINTFIGHQAGRDHISGDYNVYLGAGAGKQASAGDYNVFIGRDCGYNNAGQKNVFIGEFSGRDNEGNNNTFIGQASGAYNQNGSDNVFIGFNAGLRSNGNSQLYIENSDSNTPLIYGEFDNDLIKINGKLGINTTPTRSFQIKDVMRIEPSETAPLSPLEGDIYMDSTTHKLMVYDGTQWRACW